MDVYTIYFPFGDTELLLTYQYEEWMEHHPFGETTAVEDFTELELIKIEQRTPAGDYVEVSESENPFLFRMADQFCWDNHDEYGTIVEPGYA